MPAEWEPHDATILAWPHEKDDWPEKHECIPWVYLEILRHLTQSEKVYLLIGKSMEKQIHSLFDKQRLDPRQIQLLRVPTDRCWMRDSAPIFVHNEFGERIAIDWKFNAWAKYDNWKKDNCVPQRLTDLIEIPRLVAEHDGRQVVLEGGSIDVDGKGSMLTTEECLLSPIQARNPSMSREDLEGVFSRYLGIEHVIWLGRGIEGDDTHGHVDDITRFVDVGQVVTVVEQNRDDPNYEPLQENLRRLRREKLDVIELPMPEPVFFNGQRLPASYANFYIANEHVLVPTFNDSADRLALGILADLFPTRKVVGIHAVDLVWGLGTLHCMTQQVPV